MIEDTKTIKRLDPEAIKRYLDNLPKPKPKPKDIIRYKLVDGELKEDDDGDIVMYHDHRQLLINKYDKAYHEGYTNGKNSGYSWRA